MDRVNGADAFRENVVSCVRNILNGAREGGQIGVAITVFRHVIASAENSSVYDWEMGWSLKKDFAVILTSTLAGGLAGAFNDDPRLFGFLAAAMATSIAMNHRI